MAVQIRAYANCDDAFVVWSIDQPIPGCRGFALFRQKQGGAPETVQTWVGFENDRAKPGEHQDSTVWPIQKFMWTDYWARHGDVLRYQVVPMLGQAGSLQKAEHLASPWTEYTPVDTGQGGSPAVFFNRGIVASQWLTRRMADAGQGSPAKSLRAAIGTPNDKTRNFLSGELRLEMLRLLDKSLQNGGKIYAALYELDDPELMEKLAGFRKRANVVLANGSVKKKGEDQNAGARKELRGKINLYDRMVSPKALGHNKFLVFCDGAGKPKAAWTGSTNWTQTGLCTQMNNGILFEDAKMAGIFLDQWNRLKAAKSDFPDSLVEANSELKQVKRDGRNETVWFTRTSEQQDLEFARDLINAAEHGILFLMFNPGPSGTLLNTIIERNSPSSPHFNPDLHIHGVVNQDPGTKAKPVVGLFKRGTLETADYGVVMPEAVGAPGNYWLKEMKKLPGTFAMVHSKVIVLDPFGKHPVVMTGSHNLGPKASGVNDDNLVIIENDSRLAAEYSVNIMSAYEGYRWRFHNAQGQQAAAHHWTGLEDNDQWQQGYLTGVKARELSFWFGAAPASDQMRMKRAGGRT